MLGRSHHNDDVWFTLQYILVGVFPNQLNGLKSGREGVDNKSGRFLTKQKINDNFLVSRTQTIVIISPVLFQHLAAVNDLVCTVISLSLVLTYETLVTIFDYMIICPLLSSIPFIIYLPKWLHTHTHVLNSLSKLINSIIVSFIWIKY